MTTSEIRPFRIEIPQSEIDGLSRRLSEARYPHPLPEASDNWPSPVGAEWSRGIPDTWLRELVDYCGTASTGEPWSRESTPSRSSSPRWTDNPSTSPTSVQVVRTPHR
ncbi:epoxide hydrolase N-terminal domain-containing protein [Arthrobacter sp. cf158]|uniref:epoxide hydrolase N-terminal domain-containing protein n=1 Tax=Arthrobacter sp. cf158 TaxID=1761744 RepID=UPI0020C87E56|nr:epoxide hydrolase N-terminal domain-containing protein [Arthrobacter sp. cf158]